jgi:hypothetical protein
MTIQNMSSYSRIQAYFLIRVSFTPVSATLRLSYMRMRRPFASCNWKLAIKHYDLQTYFNFVNLLLIKVRLLFVFDNYKVCCPLLLEFTWGQISVAQITQALIAEALLEMRIRDSRTSFLRFDSGKIIIFANSQWNCSIFIYSCEELTFLAYST